MATAKGQRYQVDLNVTVGYSGVNRELAMAYNDIRDQEVVSIGLSIPILDWGKRKGQVKVAESNRDVVRSQLQQEELNFNQNIFLLTEQFNNQTGQLDLARESDRAPARTTSSSSTTTGTTTTTSAPSPSGTTPPALPFRQMWTPSSLRKNDLMSFLKTYLIDSLLKAQLGN